MACCSSSAHFLIWLLAEGGSLYLAPNAQQCSTFTISFILIPLAACECVSSYSYCSPTRVDTFINQLRGIIELIAFVAAVIMRCCCCCHRHRHRHFCHCQSVIKLNASCMCFRIGSFPLASFPVFTSFFCHHIVLLPSLSPVFLILPHSFLFTLPLSNESLVTEPPRIINQFVAINRLV